jgi:hypothetical protein
MVGRVTLKKAVRPWRDLYFVLDRDRKVVSFLDHVSGAGAAPDGVTEALRPSAMLRSKDWIYILIPFASGIAIQSVSFVAFLFFGSGATVSPDAEWIPIRVFTIVNELIVSKALTAIFALLIVLIAARTLQVWRMAAMVAFVLGAIIASRIFSLSF